MILVECPHMLDFDINLLFVKRENFELTTLYQPFSRACSDSGRDMGVGRWLVFRGSMSDTRHARTRQDTPGHAGSRGSRQLNP